MNRRQLCNNCCLIWLRIRIYFWIDLFTDQYESENTNAFFYTGVESCEYRLDLVVK